MSNSNIVISNALSLQMVDIPATIVANPITVEEVHELLSTSLWSSAVGHPDTAAVMSGMTGISIPANRVNVHLNPGDTLIVCQVTGGRLPEGCTELPEGISLKWIKVDIAVG